MFAAAFAFSIALQGQVDPNRLPLGGGESTVQIGQLFDLKNNRPASLRDVVAAAAKKRWVFLGENHATTPHQQMEASVIAALVGGGRKVAVGMEMYQRPMQSWLNQWSGNAITESDFLEKSDWKGQWGYGFDFYRPVFNVVQSNTLPLVGLNVPRDWVRTVGRGGFSALSSDAKSQLPSDMDLGNKEHRTVWNALIGGHPMGTAGQMDNMYSAQVLWDEGMADTAMKFMAGDKDRDRVFVVIAGSGHVMYKQGINWRVQKRAKQDGITVVMIQSDGPATVSRSLGDFVYVTRAEPQKN